MLVFLKPYFEYRNREICGGRIAIHIVDTTYLVFPHKMSVLLAEGTSSIHVRSNMRCAILNYCLSLKDWLCEPPDLWGAIPFEIVVTSSLP